jgi:iron complex transport system substrate-binding protein
MHPTPARLAVAILVAALLTIALARSATVVDDLGREVRVERSPERIVSMVPSHTETVCALGACGRLVGRDAHSNHPPAVLALPDLGNAFAPDLEALLALEPDLVLVDQFSGLVDVLERFDIPVYAGTPQGLDDVFELFERLGALLDAEAEAAVLGGRVRGELDAVARITAGAARPSVFFEIDPSPYSAGPTSFIGALISLAGGDNVVPPELGEFPLVDPEFVVAADPEVIVLADAPYGESLETVRGRPGWAELRAVVNGRVVELSSADGDILSRAGPRVGEAVLLLARSFHPGRF